MQRLLVGCAVVIALSRTLAAPNAQCFDEARGAGALTPAQHAEVVRGEPVLFTVDHPDRRWPQVCVYQFIAAKPEAGVAVLVDYPLRPSYLPDVRESAVVPATKDSAAKRVAYVLRVVALVTETDTLRETVHAMPIGGPYAGGYRLEWHKVSSTMASSIDGSATFIPWLDDATGVVGTLMVYDQSVEPSSRLASLPFIKGRGIDAVRNTAAALAKQVETETSQQPAQLQRQIAELHRSLARVP